MTASLIIFENNRNMTRINLAYCVHNRDSLASAKVERATGCRVEKPRYQGHPVGVCRHQSKPARKLVKHQS
jgi:hypothetical protein